MRAATFGATVLLLIPLALTAQQAPPSPVTPGADTTGSPGTTKPRQSGNEQTDNDGRYELTNLPAGSYQLTASKGGFVETQYGQRRCPHLLSGHRVAYGSAASPAQDK